MISGISDSYIPSSILMSGIRGAEQTQRVEPVQKVERRPQENNAEAESDSFEISPEASSRMAALNSKEEKNGVRQISEEQHGKGKENSNDSAGLSEEEKREVEELKQRDNEVRTHEQAHMAAGAGLTSAPKYQETTGPDGNRYATGGSVQIDTSAASTPEETIAKAQRVKAAALAPAEPSGQDRSVAAAASQTEAEARKEIAESGKEENNPKAADNTVNIYKQMSSPDYSVRSYSISFNA